MRLWKRYQLKRGRATLAIVATVAMTLALATSASANLAGSTFEGNDGNLVVNGAGNTDWANAPSRVVGIDQPSGSSDNAFGQGTKEDDPNVKVVTGSIPPNKNDLTRFYVGSEFTSGSNFLYLGWERAVNIGNANMDFEINQNPTAGFTGTTTGPVTLTRTAGDLLVTYDFSGSGTPSLGLLTWVTSGAASQCFSANALPCWGNRVDLTGLNEAEGAVNTTTVTDPVPPNAPRTLTTGLFGEAAVNLSAAGVFPPGTCKAFGSAFLKSRSSSSFPAEVKDFIAPQPVSISNCGTVIIKKVTIPSPDPTDTSFSYTAGGGLTPTSFNLKNGGAFEYDNVPVGSGYSVSETVPANWELVSATCDDGSPVSNIDVSPDETVTCTFTNRIHVGAIQITKTFKHAADGPGDHPQAGVTFTVNGVDTQTNSAGIACFDGLLFGTYTVHETVPAGYHVDTNDQQVTVDNNATCADNPFDGETVSFHNTPLTDIAASVNSQVNGGTSSTIVCKDSDGNTITSGSTDADGDGSATAANLEPGTYTCTIVIDP